METLTEHAPGSLLRATPRRRNHVSAVIVARDLRGSVCRRRCIRCAGRPGVGSWTGIVSPWPDSGASATAFTVMTAIWLIVVQWLASGSGWLSGGPPATKWANTHTHEVFFRDTAHGFITWAVATVIVAGLSSYRLVSGSASASGGVQRAATVVGAALRAAATGRRMRTTQAATPTTYDILLFRPTDSTAPTTEARSRSGPNSRQRSRIGRRPDGDRTYLAELVAARTGISEEEAQKRVDTAIAQAKAAEMKARAGSRQGAQGRIRRHPSSRHCRCWSAHSSPASPPPWAGSARDLHA